jgi:hypothetical protein
VASAKEDINFEAPEIEKIGVLFSSKEKELKDYIFRGISLFKKYEYEEKITDSEEKVTYQPRLVHPDFTLNTDNYYVTKFYIYDP